jgi:sialate O-acetylesterase
MSEKMDIWLIAGQSNAAGFALLKEPFTPDSRIKFFDNTDKWVVASEPMEAHFFPYGDPHGMITDHTMKPDTGGVGPGLFFAKHLVKYTDRPIGLIGVAAGGTMIEDWDPSLRDKNPDCLYSRMIERCVSQTESNGELKGMLWYQGESDAICNPSHAEFYEETLHNFIDQIRNDTNSPELPILYVQIGRLVPDRIPGCPGLSKGGEELDDEIGVYTGNWERIREIQRNLAEKKKNVYMVSAVDLCLDDPIHISFEGQKRLGRRLAEIALSGVYDLPEHAGPITLAGVDEPENLIIDNGDMGKVFRTVIKVRFNGVNGRLLSHDRPSGFELRFPEIKSGSFPVVYRIDFDPNDPTTVLAVATGPLPMPYKAYLYYGGGLNPYCNIVDEGDIPIPCFGPIEVPVNNQVYYRQIETDDTATLHESLPAKSRILLWPCGSLTRTLLERSEFGDNIVIGVADADPNLWGTRCQGVEIYPPKKAVLLNYEYIVITSSTFYKDILDEIEQLGVEKNVRIYLALLNKGS